MILADTSVWIEHFRRNDPRLAASLEDGRIAGHPFVLGEIALGNLTRRADIVAFMQDLPQLTVATHGEVLHFIDRRGLAGLGIGYVDAHLLAAVHLSPGTALWTWDKRLAAASVRLGIAAPHATPRTLEN